MELHVLDADADTRATVRHLVAIHRGFDEASVAVSRATLPFKAAMLLDRIDGFRFDAARRFTPSMRLRIDVADLHAKAVRQMPDTVDGQPPLPVPSDCPVTLDELLTTP